MDEKFYIGNLMRYDMIWKNYTGAKDSVLMYKKPGVFLFGVGGEAYS